MPSSHHPAVLFVRPPAAPHTTLSLSLTIHRVDGCLLCRRSRRGRDGPFAGLGRGGEGEGRAVSGIGGDRRSLSPPPPLRAPYPRTRYASLTVGAIAMCGGGGRARCACSLSAKNARASVRRQNEEWRPRRRRRRARFEKTALSLAFQPPPCFLSTGPRVLFTAHQIHSRERKKFGSTKKGEGVWFFGLRFFENQLSLSLSPHTHPPTQLGRFVSAHTPTLKRI